MALTVKGTVSLVNGSAAVTGTGTAFLTDGVAVGAFLQVAGLVGSYEVASIESETSLTLTAPYAGPSDAAAVYQLAWDFSSNFNIPLPQPREVNAAQTTRRMGEKVDEVMGSASATASAAATAAAASAASAATSETNAGNSATAAAASETAAGNSASAANASELAAAASEAGADADALIASAAAGAAATSETNAGNSATAAAASEAAAGTSETNAGNSATAAAASEAAAGTSETNAGNSATAAAASEAAAGTSATNAGNSATAAAASETAAGTSEANAGNSATAAAASETAADNSATAAAASLAALVSAMDFKGAHDASGSDPSSPDTGDVHRISVAGTIGGLAVAVDDFVIYDGAVWRALGSGGAGGGGGARFFITQTTTSTLTQNSWERVFLDVAEIDTASAFDNANDRVVPPAGTYLIFCGGSANCAAGSIGGVALVVNGFGGGDLFLAATQVPGANAAPNQFLVTLFEFDGTDYLECFGYASHSSPTVTAAFVGGFKIA